MELLRLIKIARIGPYHQWNADFETKETINQLKKKIKNQTRTNSLFFVQDKDNKINARRIFKP